MMLRSACRRPKARTLTPVKVGSVERLTHDETLATQPKRAVGPLYQRNDVPIHGRGQPAIQTQLFAAGADLLLTMETHNLAALQNAFRIPTIHLNPYFDFADALLPDLEGKDVTVMSPDLGGAKRADLFREVLEARLGRPVGTALMEKHRSAGVVSGELFAGDVANRAVIILDDMISSGGTMARAAAACSQRGADSIYLLATHGLLASDADRNLALPGITRLLLANTVDLGSVPSSLRGRLASIDVSSTFSDAIRSCIQ
jgi:ribose-phosphate pyrophosphokinase